jgi:response regulator NasT
MVGQELTADSHIEAMLREIGHSIVGVAQDGPTAISLARATGPDLVLLSLTLPLLGGLDVAERVYEERPVPIVIVAEAARQDALERATTLPVAGFLVQPVSAPQLTAELAIARARHIQLREEQVHREELERRLEDRKVIERAKGILMQRDGLSESDAYRMLQRTSQSRNVTMADLSRSLLDAESLIAPSIAASAGATAQSQRTASRRRPADLR